MGCCLRWAFWIWATKMYTQVKYVVLRPEPRIYEIYTCHMCHLRTWKNGVYAYANVTLRALGSHRSSGQTMRLMPTELVCLKFGNYFVIPGNHPWQAEQCCVGQALCRANTFWIHSRCNWVLGILHSPPSPWTIAGSGYWRCWPWRAGMPTCLCMLFSVKPMLTY